VSYTAPLTHSLCLVRGFEIKSCVDCLIMSGHTRSWGNNMHNALHLTGARLVCTSQHVSVRAMSLQAPTSCGAGFSAGNRPVPPPEEDRRLSGAGESSDPDLAALALTEQTSDELPPRESGEGFSAEAARKAAIVENLYHAERRRRKTLEAEACSPNLLSRLVQIQPDPK